jgi:hypothetical protein
MTTTKYAYTITIENAQEYKDLAWLSDRYESATKLYDLMHPTDDEWDVETFPATFGFHEYEAWQVQEAMEAEDGGFTPCLGGRLADEVLRFLDRIV